jgi:hypothetical protein
LTLISTAELSAELDGIKSKAADALVIFDTCFSGGNSDIAITRSFDNPDFSSDGPLSSKAWIPQGGERCEIPANEVAKTWPLNDGNSGARSMVFPKNNFTFVAAASEREVALDDKDKGGLATLGLLQCATAGVAGASGVVSVDDLAACAQLSVGRGVREINAQLLRHEYLPHQLAVYGNGSKTFDLRPSSGPASGSAVTSSGDSPLSIFGKFVADSNVNWDLEVEPSTTSVPVGQSVQVKYHTNHIGYVEVFYVGSDRREIKRLWPVEGQTRVLVGTDGQLPFSLRVTAPSGDNVVLVVLSQTPLELQNILGNGAPVGSQTKQRCSPPRQRHPGDRRRIAREQLR